jgi:hypothetical protein
MSIIPAEFFAQSWGELILPLLAGIVFGFLALAAYRTRTAGITRPIVRYCVILFTTFFSVTLFLFVIVNGVLLSNQ